MFDSNVSRTGQINCPVGTTVSRGCRFDTLSTTGFWNRETFSSLRLTEIVDVVLLIPIKTIWRWCEGALLEDDAQRARALRAVSEVSAHICNFSFFWAFGASKMKFGSNFAEGTHSKLSFDSQKCLCFGNRSKIRLSKRFFETVKSGENFMSVENTMKWRFKASNRNLETE